MQERMRRLVSDVRTELVEGAGHALTYSHIDRCVAALNGVHQ
jgi:hypothetical protein